MNIQTKIALALAFLALHSATAQRQALTIDPPNDGLRILAAGDTIRLRVHREECFGDECSRMGSESDVRNWRSTNAAVATVNATGLLSGLGTGTTIVRATTARGTVSAEVHVLPPVRDIEWNIRQRSAFVGDTLRISVLARDSAGRIVARMVPAEHHSGTGYAGTVVGWDIERGVVVIVLDRPGQLLLVAQLANRTDTLRIEAKPRTK